MDPHCALKVTRHLLKNKRHYHHNAIDRFGLNHTLYTTLRERIGGRWSRVQRGMEPGAEGEWLGADGWTARGVYSDGPRRLTGRPGPSEVEIFYLGIYVDIISN